MRLTRKIHVLAEKYLPEQRLYLKTQTSTRLLRLTPFTQFSVILTAILVSGWTVYASSSVLIDALSASSVAEQEKTRLVDYETRLNRLSAERDKRAKEAQKAQERFYVALKQISAQQSALLASEDRRSELETGIDVIQRTLQKTMKERDLAQIQSDKMLNELQAATGSISTASGAAQETAATLDYMNEALARTVGERDTMRTSTAKMKTRVAKLKHKAKLVRERNIRIFSRLEEAVTVSMSPLQKMFESVGLSTNKLLEDVKAGYSGIGGPLSPISVSSKGEPQDPTSLKANELLAQMDKINMMRIAAESIPFSLPLKSTYRLSSPYGVRYHPILHKYKMHDAIDLAAPYGTPVYSTANGIVVFAGWAGGYGRLIKIRHMHGFETRYAHLAKFRVKKGQRVSRGERIGDMGSSGRSTGPHTHYEVRLGGKTKNPMKYVKAARNVF